MSDTLITGAAYIRVSTDDQLEFSPDSQLKQIQDYARSHNIILTAENIFMEEEGRSGRKAAKRPEFQRMVGMAKQQPKPFDVILVWKFSRFARNQEESIVYKSMLRSKCGIDVVSVSEPVIDGPFGSLIERIIEWMDEYYSIRLSGEVLRGMAEKHSRGGVVSTPPFGYIMGDGVFVPDPERAPIVQNIFDWFVNENMGYLNIANRINDLGVRTKRGGKMELRTVRYILRNPIYIGKIRWSEGRKGWDIDNTSQVIVDGAHEPIISQEIWDAAQQRFNDILKRHPKNTYQVQNPVMLQGLVKCSNCGSTLTRSCGSGLQCIGYSHGICKQSHYIRTHLLNEMVLSGLEDAFQTSNLTIIPRQPAAPGADQKLIQDQIKREKQKLERIKAAYEDGIDTLEEYKAKKARLLDAITSLESKKVQHTAVIDPQQFIKSHADLLKELRNPEKSDEEKNEILRGFVDQIIFNRSTGSIQIFCYA